MRTALIVTFALLCLVSLVSAQTRHFNGWCESDGIVWECPAYNFTTHAGYETRQYEPTTGAGNLDMYTPPVDVIGEVVALYHPLFLYTNGSNLGNVNINRTLPVAVYINNQVNAIMEVFYLPRAYTQSPPAPTDKSLNISPVGGALPPFDVYVHRFLQGNQTVDNARIIAEFARLDAALTADKVTFGTTFQIVNWLDLPDVTPSASQRFEVGRIGVGNENFIMQFNQRALMQRIRSRGMKAAKKVVATA